MNLHSVKMGVIPLNHQEGPKTSAIIVAAGTGSRMNANINKQYLKLCGRPVLVHTIEAFERSPYISEIIVVIHQQDRGLFEEIVMPFGFRKISAVVDGGADRQASVYNGLGHVHPQSSIISVHDGARPLITAGIIHESIMIAQRYGVSCVGVPVKDTIKQVNPDKTVAITPDRSGLWAVQTPQVFQREILVRVHEKALEDGYRGTDDSVLAERLGIPVMMVPGSYTNIKITTHDDLVFAEAVLKQAQNASILEQ